MRDALVFSGFLWGAGGSSSLPVVILILLSGKAVGGALCFVSCMTLEQSAIEGLQQKGRAHSSHVRYQAASSFSNVDEEFWLNSQSIYPWSLIHLLATPSDHIEALMLYTTSPPSTAHGYNCRVMNTYMLCRFICSPNSS